MTRDELIEQAIKDAVEISCDLPHWANCIGIRYDDKIINVGDELECSISNADRDDERDFPGYDADADRLDGTSCYHLAESCNEEDDIDAAWLKKYLNGKDEAAWDHCSLVIGKRVNNALCEDLGEVVLSGCEVVKTYW